MLCSLYSRDLRKLESRKTDKTLRDTLCSTNRDPKVSLFQLKNLKLKSGKSVYYKTLSKTVLSSLTPHDKKIIGEHQCGFRRKRSTTDHIFCLRQILKKKSGNKMRQCISYQQISRKLRIDFGDSHNILVQHGTALKLGTD